MTETKEKIIEELVSFGFSKEAAEKALKESKGKTVDDVLEWIEAVEESETLKSLMLKSGSMGNTEDVCTKNQLQNDKNKISTTTINTATTNTTNTDIDTGTGNGNGNGNGNGTSTTNGTGTITTTTTSNVINDNICSNIDSPEKVKKKELSFEEKQQKILELQMKIRERNLRKEKEEALEKERRRISAIKEMQERRAQLEEHEKHMLIESRIREKQEHEKEKKRLMEQFKQEYKERFGIEYNEEEEKKKKTIDQLSENERREEIGAFINTLKIKYKDQKKDVIASLTVLKTYFTNIKDNVIQKKYQVIKKENKIFSEKIKKYDEMIQVMLLVGFVDSGECYTIKGVPNTYLLSSAVRFIDLAIRTFGQ